MAPAKGLAIVFGLAVAAVAAPPRPGFKVGPVAQQQHPNKSNNAGCVDVTLTRAGGDGGDGTTLSIRELCGARSVLVEGLALSGGRAPATTTHHLCLDTARGWVVSVQGGPNSDLVRWRIERDGELLLEGAAPETGLSLFSESCESAVPATTECTACSFPRLVEAKCTASHDTQCSSVEAGLAPVIASLVACVVAMGAASRLRKFGVPEFALASFRAFVGFATVVSDCYFVAYDVRGEHRDVLIVLLVASVVANVVGVCTVVSRAKRTLDDRFDNSCRQPTFELALQASFGQYACVLLASCIQPCLVGHVLKGFLPAGKRPCHGQQYKPIQRLVWWVGVVPALLRDIPQLVGQLVLADFTRPTFTAALAVTMTGLSLLTVIAAVVGDLVAWRHAPNRSRITPVAEAVAVVPHMDTKGDLASAESDFAEQERAESKATAALEGARAAMWTQQRAKDEELASEKRALDEERVAVQDLGQRVEAERRLVDRLLKKALQAGFKENNAV